MAESQENAECSLISKLEVWIFAAISPEMGTSLLQQTVGRMKNHIRRMFTRTTTFYFFNFQTLTPISAIFLPLGVALRTTEVPEE